MTSKGQVIRRGLVSAALLAVSMSNSVPAQADAASAKRIVKAMSDYMASQQNLASEFDVALDVTTPQLEKVTFNSSGTLLLARPGMIRATRKGGYTEMELLSDGKLVTVIDLVSGAYAQAESPGTIDSLVTLIRDTYGMDMPAGDLLMTNSSERLLDGVIEAKHIGVGVVEGQLCEHLAFRTEDTDWQLWVRAGNRPFPCKYLISSKTVVGYPTYTIQFRSWSSGQPANAADFLFKPASGARQVGFDQMSAIGELPPPQEGN